MRSQGLPITTIVLIIIAIAVLAGLVLLFYFGWFKPQSSVGEQEKISKCQSLCAQIQARNPSDCDAADDIADQNGYCDNNCNNYVTCRVSTPDGECVISCS